jgi:hypothetical protein
MPGAGFPDNQLNDALTAARFLTTAIDTHLLISSLQRSGITFAGAHQFSQGQAVTNAADRMTLARLLSELLKSPRTLV